LLVGQSHQCDLSNQLRTLIYHGYGERKYATYRESGQALGIFHFLVFLSTSASPKPKMQTEPNVWSGRYSLTIICYSSYDDAVRSETLIHDEAPATSDESVSGA
jgi:hypothetical protein